MKRITRSLLIIGLFLLIPAISLSQVVNQEKLELVRERIVFPELTDAEKRLVAEQAQIFLRDLYVHRFAKMDYYDDHADPVPAIAEVVANVDNMTTADMETAIYRIFTAQRDLHLNYYFPSPYRDYTSLLPLTFIRTSDGENEFRVRINSVTRELFERFAPDQKIPSVGDEVIAYNGLPVFKAAKQRFSVAQGANIYGGFSRALQLMTYISHRRHPVPEENQVTLVIRPYNPAHDTENDDDEDEDEKGRLYRITLPWIVEWIGEPAAVRPLDMERIRERFVPEKPDMAIDDQQEEFNRFLRRYNLTPATVFPDNPSNEPVLTWGVIENGFGRFGYLRLASFVPETSPEFALSEIRRLLLEELSDTDGLIFDVRNNGGGYITFADRMSQMFMPTDARVLKSRFLNTELNYRIMNESPLGDLYLPEWRQVINDAAGTGRMYTDGAQFIYDDRANEIGQVYYKPVAVLANARSYSATDMFSCAVQDNKAALIYGEDPLTGAGGANVITHSYFTYYAPFLFDELPRDHAMRVSWRQTIRFGDHAGDLIEDYGCAADIKISPTARDVVTGGEDQLRKVTKSLARRTAKYKAYARGIQNNQELYLPVSDLRYGVYTAHTAFVNVRLNGEPYDTLPVFAGDMEELVEIELPAGPGPGEVINLTFEGLNRRQNRVLWNLKRRIIVLGEPVSLGDAGVNMDFSTAGDVSPLTIVNRNAPEDGWNLVPPYLQLGYTPNYQNNVDSDAILFLDLTASASARLQFGLTYDTELGWDFIDVYVTRDDQETVLFSESGYSPMQTYDFDLSAFAGQDRVVVHFRFISDSSITEPGVKFSHISVR